MDDYVEVLDRHDRRALVREFVRDLIGLALGSGPDIVADRPRSLPRTRPGGTGPGRQPVPDDQCHPGVLLMKVTLMVPVAFEVEPRATRHTTREGVRLAKIEAERLGEFLALDKMFKTFVLTTQDGVGQEHGPDSAA